MLTMQAFHNKLFSSAEEPAPYLRSLAILTRTSLAQIQAVKSDLIWEAW